MAKKRRRIRKSVEKVSGPCRDRVGNLFGRQGFLSYVTLPEMRNAATLRGTENGTGPILTGWVKLVTFRQHAKDRTRRAGWDGVPRLESRRGAHAAV
jgi:hypothetical protein